MNKRLLLPGCILWVVGLAASIVGINLEGNAGQWISVIGNILFFIGLGIVGAAWLMARKNEDRDSNQEE